MAAPSGITWGDTVSGYGRIGIYIGITNTNTQSKVNVQVWFWSKYSVSDTSNKYYYNNKATSATSLIGSKTIKHTVDTGSGWSTSNQTKLGESTYTYDRGTSAVTYSCAAKFTGIEAASGTMTHTRSYTIPALTKYTVKYNANGGSGAPSSQTKYYGKTLTLSTTKPTRTGYTFVRWITSSDDEYAAGGSYTANASVTLYAKWSENILTINYYSNYATSYNGTTEALNTVNNNNVLVHSQKYYYDNTYPSGLLNYDSGSSLGMIRTGYTGTGKWGTSTSGGTLIDQSDNSFTTGQDFAEKFGKSLKTGNASVNVYAQWQINTYTVSYNANGGSGAPSSQTKTHGKTLTLSTTKPTRTGYTFVGWGTYETDTEVNYNPGGSFTANHDDILYAIWQAHALTVNYYSNYATSFNGAYSILNTVGEGKNVKIFQKKYYYGTEYDNGLINYQSSGSNLGMTRTGYTGTGKWGTSTSGGNLVDEDTAFSTGQALAEALGQSIASGNKEINIYAQWTINSYKLTVNPNGGTWNGSANAQSFTQNFNTTKSIPVPVWEGHTFTGWKISGSGSLGDRYAATTFTFKAGNCTLTASWDTNEYSVLYEAASNGGCILYDGDTSYEDEPLPEIYKSYEYESKVGEMPVAYKKNYTFLGWFTAPSGGTQITSNYVVTKDAMFYAQFAIDASAYVNDEGTWKAGIVFARDSAGDMKKGHVKINDENVWKDAFCR